MISLVLAAVLQASATPQVAPAPAPADPAVGPVVSYFAAVSARSRVLGSCAAFVEPDALETFKASVLGRPGIADVRAAFEPMFVQLVDEGARAGAPELFDGAPTAASCAEQLRIADAELALRQTGFDAVVAAASGR